MRGRDLAAGDVTAAAAAAAVLLRPFVAMGDGDDSDLVACCCCALACCLLDGDRFRDERSRDVLRCCVEAAFWLDAGVATGGECARGCGCGCSCGGGDGGV